VADVRPFRFGTVSFLSTWPEVLAEARKAESHGYDVFSMPDHLLDALPPVPTLAMLADHIGTRLGTYVLCNDFHHPVVMAKDAATLDVLSGGRFELGLGAGWWTPEYLMAGIPFERGMTRFERLTEAVQIAKLAFLGETFSFEGQHYQVHDYTPHPPAAQQPRPPLMLGGGGRRMLHFAATEADIVSVQPASVPGGGGLRASELPLRSLKDKIALVREAAGTRWADLEINVLIFDAVITKDRRAAATAYLDDLRGPGAFSMDAEVTVDDLLDSPHVLFGTDDEIAEQLARLREETGASYLGVFPHLMDAFEPILARLRGT
jgi:probable F420-dependent oxidoreductase